MFGKLCCITMFAVVAPTAVAQQATPSQPQRYQLRLVNPDGSAEPGAQVVAVMSPGARLDEDLNFVGQSDPNLALPRNGHAVKVDNRDGNVVLPDNSRYPVALLAQSEQGFAFVPLKAQPSIVTLRPWAKLKIDLSSMPVLDETHSPVQLSIVWQNSFAGNLLIPVDVSNDPFGNGSLDLVQMAQMPGAIQPTPSNVQDWRLRRMVTWEQSLEWRDQTINVPPGEVRVVLRRGDSNNHSAAVEEVHFKPIRTISGRQSDFALPQFGSLSARLAEDASLPDWDVASGERWVQAVRPLASPFPTELQVASSLSVGEATQQYVKFYGSPAGMEFRYDSYPMVFTRMRDGNEVKMQYVPAGGYILNMASPASLQQLQPVAQSDDGQSDDGQSDDGQSDDGQNATQLIEVKPGEPLELGELAPLEPASAGYQPIRNGSADPFGSTTGPPAASADPFGSSHDPFDEPTALPAQPFPTHPPLSAADAARLRNRKILDQMHEVDYSGVPLRQVLSTMSDEYEIPIYVNQPELERIGVDVDSPITLHLPPVTLESALNLMLEPLKLTYRLRNEVLEITSMASAGTASATTANVDTELPKTFPFSSGAIPGTSQQNAVGEAGSLSANDAEQRIQAVLLQMHECNYSNAPLRQIALTIAEDYDIPIWINQPELDLIGVDPDSPITLNVSDITLQTALKFILEPIGLNYLIRNEVLEITTIRCALEARLEQEFDANQRSREAELKRLEVLLEKSRQWLETRRTRRTEIISKRLDELLNKQ